MPETKPAAALSPAPQNADDNQLSDATQNSTTRHEKPQSIQAVPADELDKKEDTSGLSFPPPPVLWKQ
jgi:hypothetical protein